MSRWSDERRSGPARRSRRVPRRTLLKAGATAALPLVHVRTARAGAKISFACATHRVPGADAALEAAGRRMGAQDEDRGLVDIIDSTAFVAVMAAEAQARQGHDFMQLAPVGSTSVREPARAGGRHHDAARREVRRAAAAARLHREGGGPYRAVPSPMEQLLRAGVQPHRPVPAARGDGCKATFPIAAAMGPDYDRWTWDFFLDAAGKCAKAGFAFGLPLGQTDDSVDWVGVLFRSFGAELVDASGNITANSDNVGKCSTTPSGSRRSCRPASTVGTMPPTIAR